MKEKIQQRIFFGLVLSMLSFSMISEAAGATTLNLSPISGPVTTIVTASGTGYTASGNFFVTTSGQSSSGVGSWTGNVFGSEFLTSVGNKLPGGAIIQKMAMNITNTDNIQSKQVYDPKNFGHADSSISNWNGKIWARPFATILSNGITPGAHIVKVALNVTNTGLAQSVVHTTSGTSISVTNAPGTIAVSPFLSFSGNSPGANQDINKMSLNVTDTGLGPYSYNSIPSGCGPFNSGTRTTNYTTGAVWAEPFTYGANSNPGQGMLLTSVTMNVSSVTNAPTLGLKVYADTGSGRPGAELGEIVTGSPGLGLQTFNISPPIHITSSTGGVWIGFEVRSLSSISLVVGNGGCTLQYDSHSFGTGPNPFVETSTSGGFPYMIVGFDATETLINTKAYDDSGSFTNPGNLLGEYDNQSVSFTGVQNFKLFATTPADGNAFVGYESNNTHFTVLGTTAYNERTVIHAFGTGPNPFGSPTILGSGANENLYFGPRASETRIKIYLDNGTSGSPCFGPPNCPNTLLGESNAEMINNTGINNFTLSSVTVPSSGTIWTGIELNNSLTAIWGSTGASSITVVHAFGTGPSPFGNGTAVANQPYIAVYSNQLSEIRIKIYDDTGGSFLGCGLSDCPGNLLGEVGPLNIINTGMQNFTLPSIVVPANGNIYAAFQSNDTNLAIKTTSSQTGFKANPSYPFFSGPNPFGASSSLSNPPFINLYYSNGATMSFKFNGSPITSTPSNPSTNYTGGFNSVTFSVPVLLAGVYTVQANDSHSILGSNTFTITLPIATNTITGSAQFSTSSIIPTIIYSGLPNIITATQETLVRNGTVIQTLSPSTTIPSGVSTNLLTLGETMPYTSSYYVNTTLSDGINSFISKSNSIILGITQSPSQGEQCSIDYCPSQSLVNYTVHRTPDYKTLIMTVNLQPVPFHTECNIVNGTFLQHGKWFNYTSVYSLNFSTHVPFNDNAYYACYGSGPILSGISPGNGTLIVMGANVFNQTFGVTLGAPIGVFFIAMLASLANQRTGPIYVVVTLAAIGIMSALLFFTVPSGAWALVLITGFLGIFVGRKIF